MRSLSRRARAITLEEVAEAAGVSRATASRVFNPGSRVSPGARRAVERAAKKLGYVPNQAARSLVTGRTDTIALVFPEPNYRLFSDPYFQILTRGITDVLTRNDLQLVLLAPQSEAQEQRLERYLVGGHVDGVLLASLHGPQSLLSHLRERRVPMVIGGRPHDEAGLTYVDPDNPAGARSATAHLAAGGCGRIATITGPLDRTAGIDRRQGYREALRDAGLPEDPSLEQEADWDVDAGEAAMDALLARRPDVDGVFCASDLIAMGALRALRKARRRVPEDVSVASFDDMPMAATAEPPLTTVRQPIEEMGREMASLLLAIIAGRASVGRRIILDTELMVRASSRPTRATALGKAEELPAMS
jgi:DNA-binding LacI/PurR family transcriptional regulator